MSSQDSKAEQSQNMWVESVKNVSDRSPKIDKGFLEHTMDQGVPASDPPQLSRAFFEMLTNLANNPLAVVESKMALWQDYLILWQYTTRRMFGLKAEPAAAPAHDDKRFKDEAWGEHLVFDYIKQSYLFASNWIQETVAKAEGLDDKTVQKVEFFTKQYVDAWLESVKHNDGSWWLDWDTWAHKYSGKKIPAPVAGDGDLDIIEDALGSYVKVKATN